MDTENEQLLTVKQVAEHLQVASNTVYRLIRTRRIEAIELGRCSYRIEQSALDAFKETNRRSPESEAGNVPQDVPADRPTVQELCS